MARLSIKINLGPGASIGALSSVVGDLSAIQDLSLRLDTIAIRRDAVRQIEHLWRENPDLLLERGSSFSGASSEQMAQLLSAREQFDQLRSFVDEVSPDYWLDEMYRIQRFSPKNAGRAFNRFGLMHMAALAQPFSLPRLSEAAPELYADLVADETARRLPTVPTVERLVYENPFEIILAVIVLGVAGLKYGAFTEFAKMIRDWSADKRLREAEADLKQADARLRNAEASKAEAEAEVARRFANQTSRLDDLDEAAPTPGEIGAISRTSGRDIEVRLDEDAA